MCLTLIDRNKMRIYKYILNNISNSYKTNKANIIFINTFFIPEGK
jgi:hypothetical protein